ncbi:MAG TPA: polysaccharide deacetylase family protein [Polyangia bacterium]|nr:polysaccharide deacetylase family protein [Polyangia bacterium]
MSARQRATSSALLERPTLLALALASSAALISSLAAAAGVPEAPLVRLAVVLVAWAALGGLVAFSFTPGFDLPWRAIRRVPGARSVALTFDDGPHPDTTPALLAALRRARVRATFFLVGEAVERWPHLARQIAADGHAVGNHTQRHRLLTFRTAAQIAEEVAACQRALARVDVDARLFRPPHGFKPLGLHRVLRRHKLRLVVWQGSIRDTDAPGTSTIIERAVALAGTGRILLLHDHPRCGDQTVRAVPSIIERYRALGYAFVAIDEP